MAKTLKATSLEVTSLVVRESIVVRTYDDGPYAEITPSGIALCDADGNARVEVDLDGEGIPSIQLIDYPFNARIGAPDRRHRAELFLLPTGEVQARLLDGAGRSVVEQRVPGAAKRRPRRVGGPDRGGPPATVDLACRSAAPRANGTGADRWTR